MNKMPSPINSFVGARIRDRRVALGLSSVQFAQRIGITATETNDYELGVRRVDSRHLFRIAKVLGVEIGFFFRHCEQTTLCQSVDGLGLHSLTSNHKTEH